MKSILDVDDTKNEINGPYTFKIFTILDETPILDVNDTKYIVSGHLILQDLDMIKISSILDENNIKNVRLFQSHCKILIYSTRHSTLTWMIKYWIYDSYALHDLDILDMTSIIDVNDTK